MIDKNLKGLYKEICNQNNKHIKEGEKINAVAFILDKQNKIMVVGLFFRSIDEKEEIINKLKEVIAKTETKGYVLILDTKLTKSNKKTGEMTPHDAVLRILYTPQDKIMEVVIYKDKKIIEKQKLKGRDKSNDKWDYWAINKLKIDKEEQEKYQKFKEEHKEDYENV